jgi:hypothetical protein
MKILVTIWLANAVVKTCSPCEVDEDWLVTFEFLHDGEQRCNPCDDHQVPSHQCCTIILHNFNGKALVYPQTNLFRFSVERIRLISKAWRISQEWSLWFFQTRYVIPVLPRQYLLLPWFLISACWIEHCATKGLKIPSRFYWHLEANAILMI